MSHRDARGRKQLHPKENADFIRPCHLLFLLLHRLFIIIHICNLHVNICSFHDFWLRQEPMVSLCLSVCPAQSANKVSKSSSQSVSSHLKVIWLVIIPSEPKILRLVSYVSQRSCIPIRMYVDTYFQLILCE